MTLTTAKERPIRFKAENARAIVEDRKGQTRRPVKFHPSVEPKDWPEKFEEIRRYPDGRDRAIFWLGDYAGSVELPYQVGDRLWVQEPWALCTTEQLGELGTGPVVLDDYWERAIPQNEQPFNTAILYQALEPADPEDVWLSDATMPRWAARTFLEVTAVRVERLQDMTFADWKADFVPSPDEVEKALASFTGAAFQQEHSEERWDAIYAGRGFGWHLNPWVWVVEFKRVEAEVSP